MKGDGSYVLLRDFTQNSYKDTYPLKAGWYGHHDPYYKNVKGEGVATSFLYWLGITGGASFDKLRDEFSDMLVDKGIAGADYRVNITAVQKRYGRHSASYGGGCAVLPDSWIHTATDWLYENKILMQGTPKVHPDLQYWMDYYWREYAVIQDLVSGVWGHDVNETSIAWGESDPSMPNAFSFVCAILQENTNLFSEHEYLFTAEADSTGDTILKVPGRVQNLEFKCFTTSPGTGGVATELKLGKNPMIHIAKAGCPYSANAINTFIPILPNYEFPVVVSREFHHPNFEHSGEFGTTYILLNGKPHFVLNSYNSSKHSADFFGKQYTQGHITKSLEAGQMIYFPYGSLTIYDDANQKEYYFDTFPVEAKNVRTLGIAGATPGQLVAIGQDGGFVAKDIPKGKKVLE